MYNKGANHQWCISLFMPGQKNKKKKTNEIFKGIALTVRYMQPYRKDIITLAILGIGMALTDGLTPYLLGRFFDELLKPTSTVVGMYIFPSMMVFLVLWVSLSAVGSILTWRKGISGVRVSEYIFSGYMIEGARKLLSLPLSFHKKEKIGEVAERVNKAGNSIFSVIDSLFIGIAPDVLGVVVGFVIMYLIHPMFATIILTAVVVFAGVLWKYTPVLGELSSDVNKKYRKVYGNYFDAVMNVSTVKQMMAESFEVKKVHDGYRNDASRLFIRVQKGWWNVRLVQYTLVFLSQATIFALSIWFVTNGQLTIGELMMFNGYAAMAFGPFIRMGYVWQQLQTGTIAIAQADEVLSLPSEVYEPEGSDKNAVVRGNIVFDRVGFTYKEKGAKEVLKDITFEVKAGQTVALVGKSGAGKSTLVDLLSGYFFAKKGKVMIDGVDVKKWSLSALRSQVAVVPQEPTLLNDTVFANIKYGNQRATKEEVEKAAKLADAHGFISGFAKGYKQKVGDRGVKLSAGQKQRIAIARAFLRDPKILILDEPTSALDAEAEAAIQKSLETLMKGRTTFIIAHRLSTVRDADLVLVLKEGGIVEKGNHVELLKNKGGLYRHLYDLQNGTRGTTSSVDVEKMVEDATKSKN
jgi:ATP-binding cassette subfamily B protein